MLHQSPSMPPSMISEPASDSKMTKSATGAHISPLTSSSSNMPPSSIIMSPSNIPPLSISGIGTIGGGPTPPVSAQTNPNFPRNTRNRQTFHGKTEHTKKVCLKKRVLKKYYNNLFLRLENQKMIMMIQQKI